MTKVLLLTGTCASGKTTIANLLNQHAGCQGISEDDIWLDCFGKNRGPFLSDEHRLKRAIVHEKVFQQVIASLESGRNVVIDATVHESPPEAYCEYQKWFESNNIKWAIRVLHPRLEVAVERDRNRACWRIGERRIRELRRKFKKGVLGAECYFDNSDETPEETMRRLVAVLREE